MRGADGCVYRTTAQGWETVDILDRASEPRNAAVPSATQSDHLSARAVIEPGDQGASRAVVEPGDHLSARAVI
ncbi:MAG: hypothetical protein ACE5DS_03445, partial [Kiloniellaceae bacterium]